MVNIFDYFDYRKFLRDIYEELHQKNPNFSYRFIQDKTGIDPGFLVKVFNGQKNIPEDSIPRFSKLLKLNKRQSEYFTNLVFFGRAKSDIQIKTYFEKLLSFKEPGCFRVEAGAYEFYTRWYYTAIRELIGVYPFRGNYEELAGLLVPPIKASEAKKAVALLERLGFIKKNEDDRYVQTNRFITTGEQCHDIAVRIFQKDTINLAYEALERISKESRDISTTTVTLSPEGFSRLKEKIAEFRREVLKIANEEENATGVYHVNFQLFPISKNWKEPS
jgi:uncharacterized protein (TIGR02147 family)